MKGGDVAILPAGTGHQCLGASDDFLVIGAYPPNGTYDDCTKSEDRKAALKTIPKVARPRKDPVFGSDGPLLKHWRPAIEGAHAQRPTQGFIDTEPLGKDYSAPRCVTTSGVRRMVAPTCRRHG